MKKTILYLLCLFFFVSPAHSIKLEDVKKVDSVATNTVTTNTKISKKQVQALLGRKLTLKEKVGLFLLGKKITDEPLTEREIKAANTNAVLGLVFGILGLLVFPLFAVPGLILSGKALRTERENPHTLNKGNIGVATAGKIISWIGIALLALVLAVILILVAAGGFQ